MIALVAIVGLTLVAIIWRIVLVRREREIDQVTAAWRDEHLRERRDE